MLAALENDLEFQFRGSEDLDDASILRKEGFDKAANSLFRSHDED